MDGKDATGTTSLSAVKQALLARRLREMRATDGASGTIRPRADRSQAPLSYEQEPLWALEQRDPGRSTYNVAVVRRLRGELDAGVLRTALGEVVARHEALRTTLAEIDGTVRQIVHRDAPIACSYLDAVHDEASEAEARALFAREATTPFDLGALPLLRVALVRIADAEHLMQIVAHHVIFDGGSTAVFFADLDAAYVALRRGTLPARAPLSVHYGDFAHWQRERYSSAELDRLSDYWRDELAGAPNTIALPTDRPRSAVAAPAGARRRAVFARPLLEGLQRLARERNATLFMVLLAGFQTLLYRHSRQDDIVVGSAIAARDRRELQDVIGYLTRTLALRTRFGPDDSFDDVLARVRETCLRAYDHQDVPYQRLAGERRDGSPAGGGLFSAMFVLQNASGGVSRLGDATLSAEPADNEAAQFELGLSAAEGPEGLHLTMQYRTALFDAATVDVLLEHFGALLEAIVADPSRRISALPLASAAERRRVVVESNESAAPYPLDATVHELIAAQAKRTPDAIALRCDDASGAALELSYAELDRRAEALASALAARGVGPGVGVAVCADRSFEAVVAFLAVLKAGGHYVPLDPDYPPDRLAYMVRDAAVPVLLTLDRLGPLVDALAGAGGAAVVRLDTDWEQIVASARATDAAPRRAASSGDLAYVIYTSGSTGRPKGVMIRHRALVNFLTSMAREPGLSPRDRLLAVTTFSFDIAGLELWLPLIVGARVVLAPRDAVVEGRRLSELLASSGATMLQATPATWRLLLAAGWGGDPQLTMLCGGEALPPDLAESLTARGRALWNMYGPTETTIWSALQRVRSGEPIGLGRPVANTQLYVLEPGGEPAALGVPGELWIGGDGVAAGYLHRADLTAERFVPDPFRSDAGARMYRTGDLACRHAGGRLEYLGRVDHQVKLRGFRIELDEIVSSLMLHPLVADAVVVLREDSSGEPALAAYYVPGDVPATPAELRAHLRTLVPEFMLPTFFVALDALPRTPNGKLDRAALPVPGADARARSGTAFVGPRTPLETIVAQAFAETLGCDAVGVDDDFFDLGGHSLSAMRLLATVSAATGASVALRAFFDAPTPAGLAAKIAAAAPAELAEPQIPRPRAARHAPLSRGQELLWLHEQSFPGVNVYNIPAAYRLRGSLDRRALQRALDAVVARHEVLSARFVEQDGEPVQVFDGPRTLALGVVDLRALDERDRVDALEQRLHDDAVAPFDLARGPLARATLLRLADDEHVLLVVVHHIAFDGPSIGVLLRELAECYLAACEQRSPALPVLPIQYGDYAAWERETYAGARFEELAAYWREQLQAGTALALPTDRPRPAIESFESARLSIDLPDELVRGVLQVAREHGASVFMTMLAAFQTLLHRYTGSDDVVVGSPASSRTLAETVGLIGYLVNPLAFRGDLSGDPTFSALLERTRASCLNAYEHAALPLETFVAEQRHGSGAPLFRVMLLVEDEGGTPARLGETTLEPVQLSRGVSPFELMLVVRRTAEGMRATLHYRPSLLDAATALRMLEHLRVLLGGIADDPARTLSSLPLLPLAERRRLVEEWNATAVPLRDDALLHELVAEQVARTPNAVAVVDERYSLTYAQLDARSGALASRLRRRIAAPGELVGIAAQRSVELVVGLLAILKAGAAYVPLDPDYPAERLAFMVEDSAVNVVLADAASAARLPVQADRLVTLDPLADGEPAPNGSTARRPDPADPAYMIYTSGSTGRPKGALNAHRGICNRLLWGQARYGLTPADVVLQKTPFSFDISVWEMFWPLSTGARLVMAKPGGHRDNAYLIETIVEHGVTVVHFVPSMLRAFLNEPDVERCRTLRHVFCSGEALALDLPAAFFARLDAQLHNLYGPTEAAVEVTHWTVPRNWDGPTVPIGRPVANTRAYVLDPHGTVVPTGVPGELYIGGVQVGMGYHGRPELTAEKFVRDPFDADPAARLYRTGDLVRYCAGGEIEYLGRLDQQVKLRGYRIELGEIETVLLASGILRGAVVVMRDDLPGGAVLAAYYVASSAPSGGGQDIVSTLRRSLRATLPEYMVPTHFVALDALPLSPNGKLDRKALPKPDLEGKRPGAAAFVAPRTATEAVVAKIFADVLGRQAPVGVADDFFELGGHSLLAMRVVARATKLLRGTLSVRNFFEDPTVGGIAAALTAAEPVPGQVEAIASAVRAVAEMSPEERRRRSEGVVT